MINAIPKKQTKYGCCWHCGEQLPCWSRVEAHVHHETNCEKCGALTRYVKDRSQLPGYKPEHRTMNTETNTTQALVVGNPAVGDHPATPKPTAPPLSSAVLFLDIDGVLNYVGGPTECGMYGLDHDKVAMLEKIIDATRCRVVLSSTWRKFGRTIAKVERMLDSIGYELYDMTPDLDRPQNGIWVGASRGREIQTWLDQHPTERFVILDDDCDMGPLMPHLVNTNTFVGLTPDLADEVIRRLNGAG